MHFFLDNIFILIDIVKEYISYPYWMFPPEIEVNIIINTHVNYWLVLLTSYVQICIVLYCRILHVGRVREDSNDSGILLFINVIYRILYEQISRLSLKVKFYFVCCSLEVFFLFFIFFCRILTGLNDSLNHQSTCLTPTRPKIITKLIRPYTPPFCIQKTLTHFFFFFCPCPCGYKGPKNYIIIYLSMRRKYDRRPTCVCVYIPKKEWKKKKNVRDPRQTTTDVLT